MIKIDFCQRWINFCKIRAIKSKGGESMNQVGLVGRLTKDSVLRHLSGNRVQAHFTLAINRNYKTVVGKWMLTLFSVQYGEGLQSISSNIAEKAH